MNISNCCDTENVCATHHSHTLRLQIAPPQHRPDDLIAWHMIYPIMRHGDLPIQVISPYLLFLAYGQLIAAYPPVILGLHPTFLCTKPQHSHFHLYIVSKSFSFQDGTFKQRTRTRIQQGKVISETFPGMTPAGHAD